MSRKPILLAITSRQPTEGSLRIGTILVGAIKNLLDVNIDLPEKRRRN
jgi:hypothetical protein